jgi:hypothetical protein
MHQKSLSFSIIYIYIYIHSREYRWPASERDINATTCASIRCTHAPTHSLTHSLTPSHTDVHTHEAALSNLRYPCTQKYTHALPYTLHTFMPIHARTRAHMHIHALSLPLQKHTHPAPLTAPELADDTTHFGSPHTYNAAACGHTRI